MRLFTCLILALCNICVVYCQTDLIKLQDKLVGLSPDTTIRELNSDQIKSITEFWRIFKDIRDAELELEKLSGQALFGFNGNSSEDSEIFKVNGGITLTKGAFPSELEFSTSLNILVDNGTLQENLSNLRISYDRFLEMEHDPFLLEGYAFINRRSDAFLGVNQRYEIGGGLILAFWSKKLYKKSQEKYDRYKEKKLTFSAIEDNVVICDVEQCIPIALPGIVPEDFGVLHKAQDRIANSIVKQRSPLRIGLLIGPFLEIESISFSDTVITNDGPEVFQKDFNTTNKFRWEVRPTIDFRFSDNVAVKIRPYFKLPMPWEWKASFEGKKIIDARIEFPIVLNIKLDSRFSLQVDYTLYYDSVPNSTLLGVPGPGGQPLFLSANRRHHVYNFQVGYAFN